MKIPSLFRGDPAAELVKSGQKLVELERNIASLQATRARKSVTKNPEEILKIDAAIAAERANAEIFKDRIRALQEECRKATYSDRESRRAKALAKIKERLKRREALAADLQTSIEAVGRLYVELTTPDELESDWPFPRPAHGFAALDRRGVDREVSWALHGLVHEHRLPEPSSAGLGVVGRADIDAIVRAQNENIIARLEMTPLHEDLLDEAI